MFWRWMILFTKSILIYKYMCVEMQTKKVIYLRNNSYRQQITMSRLHLTGWVRKIYKCVYNMGIYIILYIFQLHYLLRV